MEKPRRDAGGRVLTASLEALGGEAIAPGRNISTFRWIEQQQLHSLVGARNEKLRSVAQMPRSRCWAVSRRRATALAEFSMWRRYKPRATPKFKGDEALATY